MPTKTEAISKFLNLSTLPDLALLYNYNMEVQVNVAQDDGERIEGEFHGKKWRGWKDNIGNVWKPIRIPFKANSIPEYNDTEMTYDLPKHVEGIGMTGWDWVNKVSRWVAFDFDAITGHSDKHTKKLTDAELKEVQDSLSSLPWTTIRYSTSGSGLHIYVMLDPPVPTVTHTEHAALGRAILGLMSSKTGSRLEAQVDACGQNMWVWHRKMIGTNGLSIIKQGESLGAIPANWREHINVVSGKRRKVNPEFVDAYNLNSVFDELTGQRTRVKLDSEHIRLLNYLELNKDYIGWYDTDNNMLVTHTYALKLAYENLGLRGIYDTVSEGKDSTQNCFAYPLRDGAWVVRRYTKGVAETNNWDQDRAGLTRCFLNKEPDLRTLSLFHNGVEHPQGGFHFNLTSDAQQVVKKLGSNLTILPAYLSRPCKLKYNKESKLTIEFEHANTDNSSEMADWIPERGKWKKVLDVKEAQDNQVEIGNYDDIIRHLVDPSNGDLGWVAYTDNQWRAEPASHLSLFLQALGLDGNESKQIMGSCIVRPWTIVNRPFDVEYPGDRLWNRRAPQFNFPPSTDLDNLHYPTWLSILKHCGASLDKYVIANDWCKNSAIFTGADYLKCWVASVFQKPTEPLPYLFFYSQEQNTGKSIFHEALELLVTRGVERVDLALGETQFNGELDGAVICVIEETDLGDKKSKNAYNKIKDWVTSPTISIRKLYEQPKMIVNTCHFIQCSNNPKGVPLFPGDTRITMIYVAPIPEDQLIAKRELIKRLKKEAPDFLAAILNLELPECNDRLGLPIIVTADKEGSEHDNKSVLEVFIDEECHYTPGSMIKYDEFYEAFIAWLEPSQVGYWSKIRVGKELNKNKHPKGRDTKTSQFHIANISFEKLEGPFAFKYVLGPSGSLAKVENEAS